MSHVKDYCGFNLLMALVMSNVTKSHANRKTQEEVSSDNDDVFSSGHLTTNTIHDEIRTLVNLTSQGFNQVHKTPFGQFYPTRIWTSNILVAMTYYL
jgi:hypothetical protein